MSGCKLAAACQAASSWEAGWARSRRRDAELAGLGPVAEQASLRCGHGLQGADATAPPDLPAPAEVARSANQVQPAAAAQAEQAAASQTSSDEDDEAAEERDSWSLERQTGEPGWAPQGASRWYGAGSTRSWTAVAGSWVAVVHAD